MDPLGGLGLRGCKALPLIGIGIGGHFGVLLTVVTLCAQLTRNLLAIAKLLGVNLTTVMMMIVFRSGRTPCTKSAVWSRTLTTPYASVPSLATISTATSRRRPSLTALIRVRLLCFIATRAAIE